MIPKIQSGRRETSSKIRLSRIRINASQVVTNSNITKIKRPIGHQLLYKLGRDSAYSAENES